VRNASFAAPEFVAMLRKHHVAWVVADTAGRWPEFHDVTAGFVYARLHGATDLYKSGYSETQLEQWAQRIDHWRAGSTTAADPRVGPAAAKVSDGRDVFCYFDNTDKVHAPHNAHRLLALLGLAGEKSG